MEAKEIKNRSRIVKVKLICGIIFNAGENIKKIESKLTQNFSEIDFKSDIIEFNFTNYYYPEMGKPLKRRFVGFKKLIHPTRLSRIKNDTIELENKFKQGGKRKVNIDPGYMEESKFVLASTKNFSHRIYLNNRIYGEVTLRYEKGNFTNLPWTFPDYKTNTYKNILKQARKIYKKQLKKQRKS